MLVTLGGATRPELIETVLTDVVAGLPGATVKCVVGPFSGEGWIHDGVRLLEPTSELAPLMTEADLVVTGAGQTLLEAVSLGRPSIALCIADDQHEQLRQVASAGATVASEPDRLTLDLRRLGTDREVRQRIGDAGRKLIDGRGAMRVAERTLQLIR